MRSICVAVVRHACRWGICVQVWQGLGGGGVSIWLHQTRTKIPAALARVFGFTLVLTLLWYGWATLANRDPAELTYCTKYGPDTTNEKPTVTSKRLCMEFKKLKIPAIYYGSFINVSDHHADNTQRLEVAYPSMKAWASVPWFERSGVKKIDIELVAVTPQTTLDNFRNYFLGNPKPVQHSPIYGLDQHIRETWGQWQTLLPLEAAPRVLLDCAYSVDSKDEERLGCSGTSYTDWQLQVIYRHKRFLISDWKEVHANVHTLIQSFVVTP